MKRLAYILISILIFSSCREEGYDLEVRTTDPILIVDGRIESNTGQARVVLTNSTDFLGDNPVDYVNDANVFIAIDGGEEQMLNFQDSGYYLLDNVKVDEGTNYSLRIVHGENEYEATTSMLKVQPIDFFYFEETPGFGGGDGPTYNFNMILNIDLAQDDYYITESEVILSKEEDRIGDEAYLPWNDEAYDSNPALFPFFVEEYPDSTLVNVRFSHIPQENYEFYESLTEVETQNPSSLAPSNPTSNISNGAIGSFGAFATFDTTIVIFP